MTWQTFLERDDQAMPSQIVHERVKQRPGYTVILHTFFLSMRILTKTRTSTTAGRTEARPKIHQYRLQSQTSTTKYARAILAPLWQARADWGRVKELYGLMHGERYYQRGERGKHENCTNTVRYMLE